ncbi:hypothetical protein EHS25_009291 [Saitozyma podzolica]|uniref:Uncharacterized protein n=1 Tax=Saitozyma podzolica TaxID=1890683 RepID=A0A427YLJ8_9TREE|nr:hypothetical protein EHS25_009291 [Saitozyma podzolica]
MVKLAEEEEKEEDDAEDDDEEIAEELAELEVALAEEELLVDETTELDCDAEAEVGAEEVEDEDTLEERDDEAAEEDADDEESEVEEEEGSEEADSEVMAELGTLDPALLDADAGMEAELKAGSDAEARE